MEIQGNIKWLKIKAKFQDGGRSSRSGASRINLSDSPAQRLWGDTEVAHTSNTRWVFFPEPSQSEVSAWMTSLR